jgi:hypothetical protein
VRFDAIGFLVELGRRWIDPENPFRREALEQVPVSAGFGVESFACGLDRTFSLLSREGLSRMLDGVGRERPSDPVADSSLLLIPGGRVPDPTVRSVVRAVLAGYSQISIKPPSLETRFASIFVRSWEAVGSEWGAVPCRLRTETWDRTDTDRIKKVLGTAGTTILYGSDETVDIVGSLLPSGSRFLPHGHKVSLALLCQECQGSNRLKSWAEGLARDVAVYDQGGCLSPIALYYEQGEERGGGALGELLAETFESVHSQWPAGRLGALETAPVVRTLRSRIESGRGGRLWTPGRSSVWTVALDPNLDLEPVPAARFLPLRRVGSLEEVAGRLGDHGGKIQGVALCPGPHSSRIEEIARGLEPSLIRPAGRLQDPPPDWCEDGQKDLSSLFKWQGN